MLTTDRLTVAGPGLDDFAFPADDALLVVGDVHGQNAALKDLLDDMGRMTTHGKTRHLVFLGDLVDRGPDSLGCLETAFHEARDRARADTVTFLPGNHELMLVDGIEDGRTHGDAGVGGGSVAEAWAMNGGMAFMTEVFEHFGLEMPKGAADAVELFAAQLDRLAPGGDFAAFVRTWPTHLRMGDVLCVHAGLAPKRPLADTLDLTQRDHFPRETHERHWAWIRDGFLDYQRGWFENGVRAEDPGRGHLVLHGHTVPTGVRARAPRDGHDLEKALVRMTNARVCLDGGAALGRGVAGAMVTDAALRVLYARAEYDFLP